MPQFRFTPEEPMTYPSLITDEGEGSREVQPGELIAMPNNPDPSRFTQDEGDEVTAQMDPLPVATTEDSKPTKAKRKHAEPEAEPAADPT